MTEKRHLCGECVQCLKAERDQIKNYYHKVKEHLDQIDSLIEKRKTLSHKSFYSIDLRQLIELREGQRGDI